MAIADLGVREMVLVSRFSPLIDRLMAWTVYCQYREFNFQESVDGREGGKYLHG